MMNLVRRAAVILVGLASASTVQAVPIDYKLVFTVDEVGLCLGTCDIQVGNTYFGNFTVDSAILDTDGLNQSGVLSAFFIEIEGFVWDAERPRPESDFDGFRGPDGLGSASPGFDVLIGEITNLRGGVFGKDDIPFVDFSPGNMTDCGAYCDSTVSNTFSSHITRIGYEAFIRGRMDVRRIAEPGTLALLGIGLFGLGMAKHKKA